MINIYRKRLELLTAGSNYAQADLAGRLETLLYEKNAGIEASDFQLTTWVSPSAKTLPPVEVLPYIADLFSTNIGYLFGLHEIREMMNPRLVINVDIEKCDEEYKRRHGGRSIQTDRVVYNQWFVKIKRKADIKYRIKPFIALSEALSWDIDYILGLSDVKHWQYFCLENALLDKIPAGTRFLLDDGKTIATRSRDGSFDVLKDGMLLKLDFEQLRMRDPKIICGYVLLD